MKVDFHTHSQVSPDGSLRIADYERAIKSGRLDYIAITDHNSIELAQLARKQIGDYIIVGEEITTAEGELIGLFLQEKVVPGLSALETAQAIHSQGGLVYVPHPFETVRKGVTLETLEKIAAYVDIIEAYNGRAVFQNFTTLALRWAATHQKPVAAGSDAHGRIGWGRTYSEVSRAPSPQSLVQSLAVGKHQRRWPGIRAIMYPKFNRIRKRVVNA